jgi:gamma-glutamylcyclotransferase (GGCT)/AIG2-like uncharacterized protein YtfP
MSEHLFVYGTLMSAAGYPMGARLAREATSLGPATISGRLYDLGKWPGLRDSDDPQAIVHGEVYALSDMAQSFGWLDVYEGIHPDAPPLTEYVRARRPVRLCDGRELAAWVYLYQWDVMRGQPVPEGRWRPSLPACAVPGEAQVAPARPGFAQEPALQHAAAG